MYSNATFPTLQSLLCMYVAPDLRKKSGEITNGRTCIIKVVIIAVFRSHATRHHLVHAQGRKGPLSVRYLFSRRIETVILFCTFEISRLRLNNFRRHFLPHYLHTPLKKNSGLSSSSSYAVRKIGASNTLEHRIYIEKDGVVVSPFHDIPLYANDQQTVLNMIVEIPR